MLIKSLYRKAEKPEPQEKIDRSGRVDWGVDNLYPQFLNSIHAECSVHGGIINQKVKFITAGGLTVEGGDVTVLDNGKGEFDYKQIVDLIALDFEISNTFAILYTKSLMDGRWYAKPIDFELIRVTEDNIFYEYSEDWSVKQQSLDKTNYRIIKNITKVDLKTDTECLMRYSTPAKQRILQIGKTKKLTASYYPVPEYSGSITDILSAIEMSFFTYSEVVNSFKGGTFISLGNGFVEDDPTRKKVMENLKEDSSNRETQGGLVVGFHEGADRKPEILQINGTDLHLRYEQAKKTVRDAILVAHSVVSPTLFGILSESVFGSKEEMETAYTLLQENYIKARQTALTDAINFAEKKLNVFMGNFVLNSYNLLFAQNIEGDSLVAQRINLMSPLVATKVLNNLTSNEIRRLVGSLPLDGGDTIPTATVFKKEATTDEILLEFGKFGRERNGVTILESRSFDYTDNEDDFCSQFFDTDSFAIGLTDEQKVIIKMISTGESYGSISTAIGKGGAYLSNQLITLGNLGLISSDWKVTSKGQENVVTKAEVEVLYSYETKRNAPELAKGSSSRPFCKKMIELNRMYSKLEIDAIGIAVGRDVWNYRGGWYHNPDTDRNTPSCRHEWRQNLTVKL